MEHPDNIAEILKYLGGKGIIQVLVEGGAGLLGRCIAQRAANHLTLYIGPKIFGDTGTPLFRNLDISCIAEAPELKLIQSAFFNGTIKLDYLFQS